MRYYCESAHSINHTSGSVSLYENHMGLNSINPPTNILDLGCGNGRNSLYMAKQYGAFVTLVDKDESMLSWAKAQFNLLSLPVNTICTPIEELAGNPALLSKANNGLQRFDLVILSYVIQHIDPAYYPLIFDYCRHHLCSGHLLLDVFWNPSRVAEGEHISLNGVDWYGLSYEELANLVAPLFRIVSDRVVTRDITVAINMVLSPGQTPLGDILSRQYEYYSGRIERRKTIGGRQHRVRSVPPTFNIKELSCVKLLEPLYPEKLDFVKAELQEWIQSTNGHVSVAVIAAKFLWLCRSTKIPVMLHEVSDEFHISKKALLDMLSATSYIPPLQPPEYIERICRQLQLQGLEEEAKGFAKTDGLAGCSPAVRACGAILRTARRKDVKVKMETVAATAGVTTAAIRNVLNQVK